MKITAQQVLDYYNEKGITDFPKTKSGMPHMGKRQNMKAANLVMKQEIMDKNLDENYDRYTVSNDANYRDEIKNLTEEQIKILQKMNTHCVICQEKLTKNYCRLDCEHEFCLTCIIKHSRVSNACPLCRSEFCEKEKKVEQISDGLMREMIQYEGYDVSEYENYNDDESLTNYVDAFEKEIEDFAHIVAKTTCGEFTPDDYNMYMHGMKKIMLKNVNTYANNVADRIAEYYESQI